MKLYFFNTPPDVSAYIIAPDSKRALFLYRRVQDLMRVHGQLFAGYECSPSEFPRQYRDRYHQALALEQEGLAFYRDGEGWEVIALE